MASAPSVSPALAHVLDALRDPSLTLNDFAFINRVNFQAAVSVVVKSGTERDAAVQDVSKVFKAARERASEAKAAVRDAVAGVRAAKNALASAKERRNEINGVPTPNPVARAPRFDAAAALRAAPPATPATPASSATPLARMCKVQKCMDYMCACSFNLEPKVAKLEKVLEKATSEGKDASRQSEQLATLKAAQAEKAPTPTDV